ncbi:MAG: hypothetical protein M0004_13795 [Actinomycetota bacterium]|nr:hypothetical protein [Actinomycetota bacterium]
MTTALEGAVFLVGAAGSLAASWLLVSRLERVGQRHHLSDALIGLLAALAGDGPEITSAVTALAHHEHEIGAGVVLGSNVFNLAALLGLGAVVAGMITLHRRVIVLSGAVALAVAATCVGAVAGGLGAPWALAVALVLVVPYGLVLAQRPERLARGRGVPVLRQALAQAVAEEALEVEAALVPPGRTRHDLVVALGALGVVIVASSAMERAAAALGQRWSLPGILVGGVILAAVTSIPNAVAAVYLALRQRGAAVLSTALNSNTVNAVAGLLVPGVIAGVARGGAARYVAWWYLALTLVGLVSCALAPGLSRARGAAIIVLYVVFVASLVLVASPGDFVVGALSGPLVAGALVLAVLARRARARARSSAA